MQVTKSIFIQRALLGVFWVLGTVGFVCDEFVPGLESLRSYILLACDAVLVLLGLMTLRHKADFLFTAVHCLYEQPFDEQVAHHYDGKWHTCIHRRDVLLPDIPLLLG